MKYVHVAGAVLFGGLFVFAGALKAWDPTQFLLNIRSFDLLPDPYAAWLALFLPWMEILSGLAVITGFLRSGGLLLLNAGLVVFLIAIGVAWARGIDIECGCFGGADAASKHVELILRDLLLLGLGLWVMIYRVKLHLPLQEPEHSQNNPQH